MKRALVHLLALVGLAGALLLAFGSAPAAADSLPCWKKLITDWYDGRIDGDYPAKCYAAAKKHAPEDLRQYGDLASDLTRALSVASRNPSGKVVLHNGEGRRKARAANATPSSGNRNDRSTSSAGSPVSGSNDDPPPGGPQAVGSLDPASDNSIPLPLLALGSLALLLIAAGAATFVAHRIKAHRGAATPPPKAP